MPTCDYCDTDAHKACDRCADRIYCSETCQRADWLEHRDVCVQVEDVEGAFDRLRRRTQFASILPKYFVALHQYAVIAKGKQTTPMQRQRAAFEAQYNRLKASRRVVRGAIRQEAYRMAFEDLRTFATYVIWFADQEDVPAIEAGYLSSLKSVGLTEMIKPEDLEQFILNIATGGSVTRASIQATAKTWGKKLDAHYDKLK